MELLSASDKDIKKAAMAIQEGKLVAFPTETVYGLGGDAFNLKSLARIFEVKNRPRFDPLIIHIADHKTLYNIIDEESLDALSRERLDILIKNFWPGPLTLVLPKNKAVPDLATAGLPSAAVRFPSFPLAQNLIRLSGRAGFSGAIAAPSANPFGFLSPTRAEHVIAQLGDKIDYIIDGSSTSVGLESTVLDICREIPCILRPGGVTKEELEKLIGSVEVFNESFGNKPLASPGMTKSHYAPRTPLILHSPGELEKIPVKEGEGRLYFKMLSSIGDLAEAAANLFSMLHELDSRGFTLIHAEMVPQTGLGLAINDRLKRASSA